MKTRSKDQLSLLFEAPPVPEAVPELRLYTGGTDYRSGLLEQIRRDTETLTLPLEFQAPDPQFYRDRIEQYRKAYNEASNDTRS